jgi:hypothetical protein
VDYFITRDLNKHFPFVSATGSGVKDGAAVHDLLLASLRQRYTRKDVRVEVVKDESNLLQIKVTGLHGELISASDYWEMLDPLTLVFFVAGDALKIEAVMDARYALTMGKKPPAEDGFAPLDRDHYKETQAYLQTFNDLLDGSTSQQGDYPVTESGTRSAVGVFLIIAQIVIVILAIVIHIKHGLSFEELTTSSALILPMFAVHTAAIAKYFTAHRTAVADDSPRVNGTFAFLAFLMPVLFVLYLAGVLLARGFGVAFVAPEQLKWVIGLAEIIFAVYLGIFLGTLFEEKGSARGSTPKQKARKPNGF